MSTAQSIQTSDFASDSQHEVHQLKQQFEKHKTNFQYQPSPSYEYRITLLQALETTLKQNVDPLCDAVALDFGNRSHYETKFTEIMMLMDELSFTLSNLKNWMKPSKRKTPLHLLPATAQIHYQPLGVVGIISPWNYPILLSFSPLIAAISAGNHAMIKASEFTPHTNKVIQSIIEAVFNANCVSFHQGDAGFSSEFSKLPFDHLFFTGSTSVGRMVMKAAAENLTPVTLELGGKSPVIISEHFSIDKAAQSIAFGKSINAGQTCIAPDYVICPPGTQDQLIESISRHIKKMYSSIQDNPDYTEIIHEKHHQRLQLLLQDAVNKGGKIHQIFDESQAAGKKMPLVLLTEVTHEMKIMEEEIFGPILPIIEMESLDTAIESIQAKPKKTS